jgi:hypothetical protein
MCVVVDAIGYAFVGTYRSPELDLSHPSKPGGGHASRAAAASADPRASVFGPSLCHFSA